MPSNDELRSAADAVLAWRSGVREIKGTTGYAALILARHVKSTLAADQGVEQNSLNLSGVEIMTIEQKTTHVFLRTSDEPAAHCGKLADREEVLDSIRNIMATEIDVMASDNESLLDCQIEFVKMTDAEIAELPS